MDMQARPKKSTQNVSSLFRAVNLPLKIKIRVTEHTYEVDPKHPKHNWLYPAFRAFQRLEDRRHKEGKKLETFVTIGSGQGLDAIGAYHIFHPKKIILTDIHPQVVPIVKQNFLAAVADPAVQLDAYVGNLCQPLQEHSVTADIIYANLPNIPLDGTGAAFGGQLTSTFFDKRWISHVPLSFQRYLLGMQYAFLSDASHCLASGGSVIINLGGRMPITLVKKMFQTTGYTCEELFVMLKEQSQPEWVLGGYARAEKKHGVTFDFYRLEAAEKMLGSRLTDERLSAAALKRLLKPVRLSATQALKRFLYASERIGHIVEVIHGVKK